MKKIKRIVSLAATLALAMSFVACGNSSTGEADTGKDEGTPKTETTDSGDKPYVAVISKGFQHQFWQVVKKGAEDAAAKYEVDITFEGPASESDINDQVNMINAALAKKEGIPVVGFDSGIPGAPDGQVAATASTDNYNAATIAADKLFEEASITEKIKASTAADPVVIGVVSQDATSASL
ncbi:MAG: LacI family transcriptional regulator, partial [Niameybacter sp.]